MRKKIETKAATPRRPWVLDARRSIEIVKRGNQLFHWRPRTSHLKPVLRAGAAALVLLISVGNARAAFDNPSISAQAAAMGGSSLAGVGDSAAMFLNAAGTAGLKNPETYLMYNQLYAGLSGVGSIGQGLAAFGIPTRIGTLGIGFSDFQAAGLLEERIIGVTFARRWFNAVDAGITGKYLYHRYFTGSDPSAGSDPVFGNGASRGAPALDAGAIISPTDALKIGLVIRNINQPNIGLASEDRVPREFQGGLAYNIEPWALRATADYTYRAAPAGTIQQRSQPGIGLEKSFLGERVKFRIGVTLNQFSGGLGVQFGRLGLDYAIILSRNLISNNIGTHQAGIRYRFGGDN